MVYATGQGVNFFDTADVYGDGSEKLLAKATKGKEYEIFIATKFCKSGDIIVLGKLFEAVRELYAPIKKHDNAKKDTKLIKVRVYHFNLFSNVNTFWVIILKLYNLRRGRVRDSASLFLD